MEGTFTKVKILHSLIFGGSSDVVDGLFFGHFFWKVEGSCVHTRESRVAHMHGNALTCSISSMVEGSPSCTAHVWLMCMVMPSRVAFPQWWRGAPHVQLTCGTYSRVGRATKVKFFTP